MQAIKLLDLVKLLGGLAFFVYGMNIMSTGMERLAGGRFERFLGRLGDHLFKGVLLGALVTATIQSSSIMTVLVVGLVNARVIKLRQAVGLIMGANIGTTATAHLLRLTRIEAETGVLSLLRPALLAPLAALVGLTLLLGAKKVRWRSLGQVLMGFGLLFTGMMQMEAAFFTMGKQPWFGAVLSSLFHPLMGLGVGVALAAVIQSSAVSVGVLQALSVTGLLPFYAAIPIILGQNIGTCLTPMLASAGASRNARQAAAIHLVFNLLGATVLFTASYSLQALFHFQFWEASIASGGIANLHTLFKLVMTALLLPFAGQLEHLARALVSDRDEPLIETELAPLDDRLMASPALAIEHSRQVAYHMAHIAQTNLERSLTLLVQYDHKLAEAIKEDENTLDRMEDRLDAYLVQLAQRQNTDQESQSITELLHVVNELERIGDQAVNILEKGEMLFETGSSFSPNAQRELDAIGQAVLEIVRHAVDAYRTGDQQKARSIEPLEEVIDLMEETLKSRHINRLRENQCSIDAAFPFIEVLASLEKAADYCSNIGVILIRRIEKLKNKDFEAHDYVRRIHEGNTQQYAELFKAYEKKYFSKIK